MLRRRDLGLGLAAAALGRSLHKAAAQAADALTLAAAGAGSAFLAFGKALAPVVRRYAAALLGYADEVTAGHPAARSMRAGNAGANTFMPFHSGAVRYYREAGVALRADLSAG
jgi:hypothetical protein